MNNSFDINVLVNGNRCKFYYHDGKTFIEAKHGSEYELEIKNNTWRRVLCLTSVDGLNIITGKTATDEDPGYVIPAYSPLRIKGFRYSNDEVAAFKFTTKSNSYAHNQGGYEASKNCGVIGFRIYDEYVYAPPLVIYQNWLYEKPYNPTTLWGTTTCVNLSTETTDKPSDDSLNILRNFDMGSTWGKKIESKVVETNFGKGCLILSFDIYYASRQSLINMGVPINVGHQIAFPQSFTNKYATPPSDWTG